jgi:hypothetical protein
MLKAFVEKILELADVKELEIGGRPYTDKAVYPIKDPVPDTMGVHTLQALVDYLKDNPDDLNLGDGEVLVHITSPTTVQVLSNLSKTFCQRRHYLLAEFKQEGFTFRQFIPVEQFIIDLQSKFQDSKDLSAILKLVGNLKDGLVTTFEDDGATQQATVKTGIARVENANVPRIVKLKPYRTFPEIDPQIESPFLFRMRSGQGEGPPTMALFEADGGAWRIKAIAEIKKWLSKPGQLPKGTVILA